MKKHLVTGAAGFVGFNLVKRLLERGETVVGIDNINDYYDVNLKFSRLENCGIDKEAEKWHTKVKSNKYAAYTFIRMNLEDREQLNQLFESEKFDTVCNLAAQAGVRYSIKNPHAYIQSNIVGFINVLEACRYNKIKHLVYASSSSVYGNNTKMPLSTDDNVDHPISLYAATKKSNELMAHSYSHLFNIPCTGLRFFTVYGPWGRPDMAIIRFTKAILENKAIEIYNRGEIYRDFTYIDDIVEGVIRVLDRPPYKSNKIEVPVSESITAPYKIYNLGNSTPVNIMDIIDSLEQILGKTAKKEYLPMQAGDVFRTEADVSDLQKDLGYKPNTSVYEGIKRFVEWYRAYNIC